MKPRVWVWLSKSRSERKKGRRLEAKKGGAGN